MKNFTVVIGLSPYKVKFKKKPKVEGVGVYGSCDFEAKIIEVDSTQAPDLVLTSLLHEFCHALLYEIGEPEMATTEHVVENMSQNVARMFKVIPKELIG